MYMYWLECKCVCVEYNVVTGCHVWQHFDLNACLLACVSSTLPQLGSCNSEWSTL